MNGVGSPKLGGVAFILGGLLGLAGNLLHPRAETIVSRIGQLLGKAISTEAILEQQNHPHDVPGDWFKGPF